MCGCGRTSKQTPGPSSAGPIWSKKMKGPTRRRSREGNTRRTSKPPRSRGRASIRSSMAAAFVSTHFGSFAGRVPLMVRGLERFSSPLDSGSSAAGQLLAHGSARQLTQRVLANPAFGRAARLRQAERQVHRFGVEGEVALADLTEGPADRLLDEMARVAGRALDVREVSQEGCVRGLLVVH